MGFRLIYTKRAERDAKKLEKSEPQLKKKAIELLKMIIENPFQNPPPYEKLIGDLNGMYSRRINIQHRIVYDVIKEEKAVKILSMYLHY
ncbi:MAG: Txe/YoeB family addiction module toxin [Alkaliphilus sp.]|nr:MAG: Txe/YoeB family addiction module toxin [Alkaliphilus sp.]